MAKSLKRGKNILTKPMIHTTPFGLWLLVEENEYFLSFQDYPWFQDAKLKYVMNVQMLNENHIRWPDLDVDLEMESLVYPEKYALKDRQKKSGT